MSSSKRWLKRLNRMSLMSPIRPARILTLPAVATHTGPGHAQNLLKNGMPITTRAVIPKAHPAIVTQIMEQLKLKRTPNLTRDREVILLR